MKQRPKPIHLHLHASTVDRLAQSLLCFMIMKQLGEKAHGVMIYDRIAYPPFIHSFLFKSQSYVYVYGISCVCAYMQAYLSFI